MSEEKFSQAAVTPVESVADSLSEPASGSAVEGLPDLMDRHDRIRIEGLLQLAEIHERTANLQEGFIREAEATLEGQGGVGFNARDIFESGGRHQLRHARRTVTDSRERAIKYREQAAILQYRLSGRGIRKNVSND